ncbi:MAG: glutathione peroxidase [Pseudomonadales bacterium]|nr:glutathione peroxidase [Pseudomonadales bacterium]
MENREGQQVPEVTFKTRDHGGWKDITSSELFASRTVIVFSLPGAFTPTCSGTHLPRYEELAPTFRQEGVDEIVCISVNDGFIMHAWANDQALNNIRLLPDGNGEFTDKMGMLVDKRDLGFGSRSWRYSMLVKDGVIEKMFIEPDVEGDPFSVSDADTMLTYINAEAKVPETVAVITRAGCPHCLNAKELLNAKNMNFNEITLGEDIDNVSLRALAGSTSVPQVFIGGKLIGGSDDLEAYFARG